jgi:hypothetical protein
MAQWLTPLWRIPQQWMINSRGEVRLLESIPHRERHKWRPAPGPDQIRTHGMDLTIWDRQRGTDLKWRRNRTPDGKPLVRPRRNQADQFPKDPHKRWAPALKPATVIGLKPKAERPLKMAA